IPAFGPAQDPTAAQLTAADAVAVVELARGHVDELRRHRRENPAGLVGTAVAIAGSDGGGAPGATEATPAATEAATQTWAQATTPARRARAGAAAWAGLGLDVVEMAGGQVGELLRSRHENSAVIVGSAVVSAEREGARLPGATKATFTAAQAATSPSAVASKL